MIKLGEMELLWHKAAIPAMPREQRPGSEKGPLKKRLSETEGRAVLQVVGHGKVAGGYSLAVFLKFPGQERGSGILETLC